MDITKKLTPNRNVGRSGWIPDIIVCHITEGSFPGSIDWVTNPKSKVSYHFMVSKTGTVTQCVEIANTAWANGTTTGTASNSNQHSRLAAVRERNVNANFYTISIGFEGRISENIGNLPPAQLAAAVELIRHIRAEVKGLFGKLIPLERENIVAHSDVAPKWSPDCPGAKFPFNEILHQLESSEPGIDDLTMEFRIKGKTVYLPAFVKDDRIFAQVRGFAEAVGCRVSWDDGDRVAVIE